MNSMCQSKGKNQSDVIYYIMQRIGFCFYGVFWDFYDISELWVLNAYFLKCKM